MTGELHKPPARARTTARTALRTETLPLPLDFSAFHQMYRIPYVRYAWLRLGSLADAEEVVDAAFEKLLVKWQQVLSHPNAGGYAWSVLRHQVIDHLRRVKRQPALVDVAAFESVRHAIDPIAQLEEKIALYRAIAQLPERQCDVITLRYVLGYSTDHVASIMGVTVATVRSHISQARRRLAAELGLEPGDGKQGG